MILWSILDGLNPLLPFAVYFAVMFYLSCMPYVVYLCLLYAFILLVYFSAEFKSRFEGSSRPFSMIDSM